MVNRGKPALHSESDDFSNWSNSDAAHAAEFGIIDTSLSSMDSRIASAPASQMTVSATYQLSQQPGFLGYSPPLLAVPGVSQNLTDGQALATTTGAPSPSTEMPVPPAVPLVARDTQISAQQDASLIRLADFRADLRFAGINGVGTTVVVIDTGIDLNHSFFGADADHNGIDDRIIYSYDFYGSNDSDASDFNGHGSNVASIIGSQDATYTGMAPACNLIVLKVFPDGSGGATTADVKEALDWVVAHRSTYNIVSVNMSLGEGNNINTPTASSYAADFASLASNNCAVVVASGNEYYTYQTSGVSQPSADPNAWSVGAVWDRNAGSYSWQGGAIDFTTGPDRIISFSQRSSTMSTIFAPGGQITGANWNGGTITESGTSQAAPHIAGLVADMQQLALQVSGHLMSVADLRSTMVSSAVNIVDGDDENDNVANTGATYHRVDVLAWGTAILNLLFAGTSGADTLTGTAANDAINGQGGNDTINGQGGNDTIRGGSGNDAIDGGAGTDGAIFSGLAGQYTLSALGGNSVRVTGPDGTDTLTNVEKLVFDDQTIDWPSPSGSSVAINDVSITEGNSGTKLLTFTVTRSGGTAAFDVNFATADGTAKVSDSDYVANSGTLHFGANVNSQTISVTINGDTKPESNETFLVNLSSATNGATISDSQGVGTILNDDKLPGIASNDFNGDGNGDILWRYVDGSVAEWQMNGQQVLASLGVAQPDNSYRFQDTGDLNGDGKSDIIFRHTSGQVVLWEMNSDQIVTNTSIFNVANSWHMQGVGDFGGDGKSDILWRHDSGQVVLWQMNGDQIATNTAIAVVGQDYHILGVGDFNGDGHSDVLWRSDSGQVIMWQMNGDKIVSNTAIGNVSQDYQVAGIGDFNGDGRADVMWRHSSGQIVLWEMNGTQITSNTQILNVSNQYHVQDVRDYNGDGMSDVLLRHDVGQLILWQMNGDKIASNVSLGVVDNAWTVQAHHFDFV